MGISGIHLSQSPREKGVFDYIHSLEVFPEWLLVLPPFFHFFPTKLVILGIGAGVPPCADAPLRFCPCSAQVVPTPPADGLRHVRVPLKAFANSLVAATWMMGVGRSGWRQQK